MDFNVDHFTLFGLPRLFRLDVSALDGRYRELAAQVHPVRFTQAGDAERRLSLQWATRVNEAYQILKSPLTRAQYLLSLAGHNFAANSNTAMPPEFLMEQMEWREAVAEARQAREHGELEQLHHRVKQRMTDRYEQLAELLDGRNDQPLAADCVRRLMFLERLLFDIDEAMAALEA